MSAEKRPVYLAPSKWRPELEDASDKFRSTKSFKSRAEAIALAVGKIENADRSLGPQATTAWKGFLNSSLVETAKLRKSGTKGIRIFLDTQESTDPEKRSILVFDLNAPDQHITASITLAEFLDAADDKNLAITYLVPFDMRPTQPQTPTNNPKPQI